MRATFWRVASDEWCVNISPLTSEEDACALVAWLQMRLGEFAGREDHFANAGKMVAREASHDPR